MKNFFFLVLIFVGATLALQKETPSFSAFNLFKAKFQKVYAPEEEVGRFQIFQGNLEIIRSMSAREPEAQYGVTKFADLTPAEFKNLYLMNITAPEPQKTDIKFIERPANLDLPSDFDWKSKGVVTPVKNQGQCGSCWDFSATETIESVCAIAGYPLTTFSEQQVLDCDQSDYGCNGGWPFNAYNYVIKAGGMEKESDYPYRAVGGKCQFDKNKVTGCKVNKWEYVTRNSDENAMQNFLFTNSPVSICVDALSWQFYTGGVITTKSGCGKTMDHCVQLTGWSQMQGMTVWNVRNSWGADWGVSGYIYIQKGADVCGIAQVVTAPCVTSPTGSIVC